AVGDRSGLALLRDPATRRTVGVPAALAVGAATALALSGDREAAGDTARLTALALVAPPSLAFAGYFGGWHALRHTARVTDALVADDRLADPGTLPRAVLALGRRSAWAVAVGLVGAGVLAARDPRRASDNAFAAVLGLTVPHMTTVALELARKGS
ncbi:MAG: putative beta-carotene 15,15-dioxygenase, partial [Frankiales bacterium]|nr:putative beta-carotene 15,15-dioxygenase [Frankiales bacterium]